MINEKSIIVLTFVAYYLPGYKSGGPLRTLSNIVEFLGQRVKFKIITLDRDVGDTQSYKTIKLNEWNKIGHAEVFYLKPQNYNLSFISRIVRSTSFSTYYFNSIFSYQSTILPLILKKIKLIPSKKIIIAPRGELFPGVLNIKSNKKKLFLLAAKITGLFNDVLWHASSKEEQIQIQKHFGNKVKVHVALDLPSRSLLTKKNINYKKKQQGKIDIIFISRIVKNKGLDIALKILFNVKQNVIFNIYGNIEDLDYWQYCKETINKMPQNIKVNYLGKVKNEEVSSLFENHDLFFFPTRSENFGHVIFEALASGCPVLISDQTPWKNLKLHNAGWSFSLTDEKAMIDLLEKLISENGSEFEKYKKNTKNYLNTFFTKEIYKANFDLFQ